MYSRPALLAVACLLAIGCDKPKPQETEPPEVPQTVAEPPGETTGEAPKADNAPWTAESVDALDEAQTAQLEQAKAAQKKLGGTLAKALTTSVAKDGFPASIKFCQGEAPDIAEKIATSHGLKIGRTSHKLRNPKNTAPAWAEDAVAAAEPGMKVFSGPDGQLGVLSPIEMAPLCVNCHGATDKLAEGVAPAIEALYPEDQATGFAAGDLRGWFWVEVPTG